MRGQEKYNYNAYKDDITKAKVILKIGKLIPLIKLVKDYLKGLERCRLFL